jgi:hypothetical protein
MAPLKLRFEYPDLAVVVLLSNHQNVFLISTPEAIGAATRIKADMDSVTVHDLSNVAHICDESQILHAAACILRRQISDITISDDEYPT